MSATTKTTTPAHASQPQSRPEPLRFFVWKDSFRVGIEAVDRDHQQFFEIINRLYHAMVLGKGEVVVRSTLADLIAYAREHFAREERELDAMGYPGQAQHQAEHRYFLQELERMKLQRAASAQRALVVAREWLLEHILSTDKKYATWLARRGSR